MQVMSELSRLTNHPSSGHTWALMGEVLKPHVGLCRTAPAFLFLDQQLRNDHEIVGEYGGTDQEFEVLPSLGQATLHATAAEENRDAPLDTGTETLSFPELRTSFLSFTLGSFPASTLRDTHDRNAMEPAVGIEPTTY